MSISLTPVLLPVTALALAGVAGSALATQYLTPEQAQQQMFPEANQFRAQPLQLNGEQMKQVEKLAGLPARSVSWRVVAAYKDEKLLGYVVLDVDKRLSNQAMSLLKEVKGTVKVRMLY